MKNKSFPVLVFWCPLFLKEIDNGTVRVTLTEQCVKKKHLGIYFLLLCSRLNNPLFVLYIFSGLCSKVTLSSIFVTETHYFDCEILHNLV